MPTTKVYYYLLIIFICTFSFFKANANTLPLKGKTIYLDPGHGGVYSGAKYKDILEKDINLNICYELKSKLENKGATIYMTRYDDYDLSNSGAALRKRSDLYNRAKIINNSEANLYLSIHLNSTKSSKWNGVQIFYDDINEQNKIIAQYLQDYFDGNRKISEISDKYMYKRITKPGVLVELGFLSNSVDRSNLMDDKKREELIDKIVNGVIKYYEQK